MASWRWDSVKGHYVSPDGEVVDTEALIALRDRIADFGGAAARELVDRLLSEAMTLVEWAESFLGLIGDLIAAGYLLGRGGAGMATAADVARIAALVAAEAPFAKEFGKALAGETLTAAQAGARAELYAGAAVKAFDVGRGEGVGIALPCYPADGGTRCMSRCRCFWDLEVHDDHVIATWVTREDLGVCDDCRGRERRYALLRVERSP